MRPLLLPLAAFFLLISTVFADAKQRPQYKYPEGYTQAVTGLKKRVTDFPKDESYKPNTRIALPPKPGDKTLRLVRYGDLDEMSQDLYRLKVGEALMLHLESIDKYFAEDASKVTKELAKVEADAAKGGGFISTIKDLREQQDAIQKMRLDVVALRREYAKTFYAFSKTVTTKHAGKLPLSFQRYPRTIRVWTSKAGLMDEPEDQFFRLDTDESGRYFPRSKPAKEEPQTKQDD